MQNNQKVILCASDLHLNFETVQLLIEREKHQQFDAVFLLGDFLNLQHQQGEDSELDKLRKLLSPFKSFGCPIYFIPGNHDSDELLYDKYLEEGFINIHKKSLQIRDDLWIVGLGGSIPGYNKQGLIWQGYPYKSDEEYSQDLEKLKLPKEGKIILITHIGPALSQTTISSENGWDDVIKSGSDSQSNLIKNKKNIILNVHGHTHDGVGSRMMNQCKVVNVGPLLYEYQIRWIKLNIYLFENLYFNYGCQANIQLDRQLYYVSQDIGLVTVELEKKGVQQQQQQKEQQDEWDERTIEAEEANPTLENKEKAFSYFRLFSRIFWWTTSALFGYNLYLNNYKTDPTQELGYQKHINDAAKYCQDQYQAFYDFMTKPAIDKLLPDIPELPFGYEIPKTLVLNISGTLLHMDYVFGVGGEIKRRNGLQRFLEKLPKMYEVVILSDDETMFTQQITQKLDPTRQIFAGAFGRESMVFEKGRYIRDLKYLNRPLNRVIVLDSDSERMYQYQDNGIFIKPFDGKQNDEVLKDVLLLLEHLSKPQIKDVRAELRKFGNFDPQIKYLDEVKAREINIKQTMNKGIFGIINQRKNPQFEQSRRQ